VSVRIHTASEAHASLLSELGARTFVETFASENTPENMSRYLAETFTPERQREELLDARNRFLIAFSADAAIGYAQLKLGSVEPCVEGLRPVELVRLYVKQAWHGRKVGAALMQQCLEEALQMGARTIWLGVWGRNERACAFYERWGFVKVGSHVFQLGDDPQTDLIMQRTIASPV